MSQLQRSVTSVTVCFRPAGKRYRPSPAALKGIRTYQRTGTDVPKSSFVKVVRPSQYAPTYDGLTLAPSAQGPRDNAGHDPSGRPRVTALASLSAPGSPKSCGGVPGVYARTRVSPAMPRRGHVSRRRARLVFTLWSRQLCMLHAKRKTLMVKDIQLARRLGGRRP